MAHAVRSSRLSDVSLLSSRNDADKSSATTIRHHSVGPFLSLSNGGWSGSSIWGNGKLSSGLVPLQEHSTNPDDVSSSDSQTSPSLAPPLDSLAWNRRSSNWNSTVELPAQDQLARRASENPFKHSALSTLQTAIPRSTQIPDCSQRTNALASGFSVPARSSAQTTSQSTTAFNTHHSTDLVHGTQFRLPEAQSVSPISYSFPIQSSGGGKVCIDKRSADGKVQLPKQTHSGHTSPYTVNDPYGQFLHSHQITQQGSFENQQLQRRDFRLQYDRHDVDVEALHASLTRDFGNFNVSERWTSTADDTFASYGSNGFSLNCAQSYPQSPPLSAVPHSPNYTYSSANSNTVNHQWMDLSNSFVPPILSRQARVDHPRSLVTSIKDNRGLSAGPSPSGDVSPGTNYSIHSSSRHNQPQQAGSNSRVMFDPRSPSFTSYQHSVANAQMRLPANSVNWPALEQRVDYSQFAPQVQQVVQQRIASHLNVQEFVPEEVNVDWTSLFLEEFKSNLKKNSRGRRAELSDIKTFVAQVAGDQNGSRFIQERLETAKGEEKDMVFAEVIPNARQLMMDVFGNYVCQKFFEFGTQLQKRQLADAMLGHMLQLSKNTYACRVVQKALEHVLVDQQAMLVHELKDEIVDLIRDANANHVIQVAISRVPIEHVQFIVETIVASVQYWAVHCYGCRVVQRLLEKCDSITKQKMLNDLHSCAPTLIADQYGNYVAQCIIATGSPQDRQKMMNVIKANLFSYSRQKYASNTVERIITFGTEQQRKDIMLVLAEKREGGESILPSLVRDQYGNYVIQTLLERLTALDRAEFISILGPEVAKVKRASNKQSESVESKMHKFDSPHLYLNAYHHPPPYNTARNSQPGLSTVPTPALTNQSAATPRSSSESSANGNPINTHTTPTITFTLEVSQPTAV